MKRMVVVLASLLVASTVFAQTAKVAIVLTNNKEIDADTGDMLLDKIGQQLLPSKKFAVLDQSLVNQGLKDLGLKLSSITMDGDTIKAIGHEVKADYLINVKLKKVGTLNMMSATMTDIESLELVAQASQEMKGELDAVFQLGAACGQSIYQQVGVGSLATAAPSTTSAPARSKTKDSAPSPAKKLSNNAEDIAQIEPLLKKNAFMKPEGRNTLSQVSLSLDLTERQDLYNKYRYTGVDLALTMALNWLPGFGIGSFLSGDIVPGIILASTEAVGGVLISTGDSGAAIGAVILVGSYIYGFIAPPLHRGAWNKNLQNSLNTKVTELDIQLLPSFSLAAITDESGKTNYGVQVGIVTLRY